MRNKFLITTILLVAFTFISFDKYQNDDDRKDAILCQVVHQVLKMGHFKSLTLNDEFSQNMYDLYIKKLDYGKRFLLQEDIELLNKYKKHLSKEIKHSHYNFFNLSVKLLKMRMLEAENMCSKILKTPFNFKKKDNFEADTDKLNFAKNKNQKYARWKALLKYQAMIKLDRMIKIREDAIKNKDTTYVNLSYKELEEKARKELDDDYKEVFRRYSKINHTDWIASYLSSYTECYDPHSQYMAPKTRDNFDIGISGKLEGIGATLTERKGYVKVVKILPGSPSWKQGELKEGDLILKVAQGKGTPVNVVDMRLDEAVKLIRGKKGTEVRLTVKKPDNTIVVIPIIRDVVMFEATFAKSAILQVDNSDKRYGYIYLPSFYVDFRHRKTGRHCADDVEQEIAKLKKAEVDGIIVDLRNNSGGSLSEVVKMAGFFIKDGPIVQVSSKVHKPRVLRDRDSRIQYDGDLVVLVNRLSASASEIFAAAMQDYKRAVIVGASKTHGKGTVQNIVNLDQMINPNFADIKPLGSLRFTIQKFYRVNGGATQLKGVNPDVVLPDMYEVYDTDEEFLPNALKWDEIQAVKYTLWPLPIDNMQQIKDNSMKRVQNNKAFKSIIKNIKRLKEEKKNTKTTLNIDQYRKEQEKLTEESKQFKEDISEKTSINAFMLEVDSLHFKAVMDEAANNNNTVDSSKYISRKKWIEGLSKDAYIEEAVYIMKDIE